MLPAVVLCAFRDAHALGTASESLGTRRSPPPAVAVVAAAESGARSAAEFIGGSGGLHEQMLPPQEPLAEAEAEEEGAGGGRGWCCYPAERHRRYEIVPPLVACADTFQFLGSGMTVRFFSLFFCDLRQLRRIRRAEFRLEELDVASDHVVRIDAPHARRCRSNSV